MLATIMFHWLAFSAILAAQEPAFDSEVRPILERNCLGCHNQKLKMSNFSIATRTELLKGGKRGGSPERILEAIRQEGNLRMPPSYKLKQEEIAIVEKWITAGASMPESAFVKTDAKPNHWAFATVKRPLVPEVRNAAWARTLKALPSEGFYVLPETINMDGGGKWLKNAIVELGYNEEGKGIIFVGQWQEDGEDNSLLFSDRGMMVDDRLLAKLIWAPILPVNGKPQ